MFFSIDEKTRNLFGQKWPCNCGRVHEVPMRAAIVARGALARVGKLCRDLGLGGPALLIADNTTWNIAGPGVATGLTKSKILSRRLIVPGERPHADAQAAAVAAQTVAPSDAVIISIGSGTVTDLAKWAAFAHGKPHIAVATAPSMNGYASGIAALTENGLKTTRAVRTPVAVVADLDVLSTAPLDMIRAGLGDLLSKPVCNADWKLASIVCGEHFCMKPFELIRDIEHLYIDEAIGVGERRLEVIEALTWALILSGVSMVIAGSSAPASGGEHLISHFLDMHAGLEGREGDLHGAQVGVASLATAELYERLMSIDNIKPYEGALDSMWERSEEFIDHLRQIFGPKAEVVISEFQKKCARQDQLLAQGRLIRERWDEIRTAVRPFLMPTSQIRSVLNLAGAKIHYSDLGVDAVLFREALIFAMCIRNRYTVLDLAFAIGELEEWAEEVIKMPHQGARQPL